MGYLHMENKTGWEYENNGWQKVNKKNKKNQKIVIHNSLWLTILPYPQL